MGSPTRSMRFRHYSSPGHWATNIVYVHIYIYIYIDLFVCMCGVCSIVYCVAQYLVRIS
jgi:hypothetical protein